MNWNVVSKIAGGVTAAAVLYNAHDVGKKMSEEYVKERGAERMLHFYGPSRRTDDRNATTSKLKDFYFRVNADWNLPDKINAGIGYVKGAFLQMAADVIPAALATGALLTKKFSKLFTAGLALYGIKYLVCDVMDVGRPNHLHSSE